MAHIHYLCEKKTAEVDDPDMTILEVSIAHKIRHYRECGGHGRCTTCRIRILNGMHHVSPRTEKEADIAQARDWDDLTRLACQTHVTGDIVVQRLINSGGDVSRLQWEEISLKQHGQEQLLAILFCDIRDFTPFVDRNLPYDVMHMLNRFFAWVGEPILLNNGVIYQYVGDEITGLFGIGGDTPEKSSLNVIRAGLGMLNALQNFNADLEKEFGVTLDIGIGAHFGHLISGQIGHPSHRQFAVIGDAINVCSRIQSMNKALGTKFLVSEDLLAQIPQIAIDGRKNQATLKGKHGTFNLVEVRGFSKPDPAMLVQETAGILMQQQVHFTDQLYQRFFARAPETKILFGDDMQNQGRMLSHMLQILLYAMSRPENLELGLQDLGQRHKRYGVQVEHYPIIRQVFIEALETVLEDKLTPQHKWAWTLTIDTIIHAMNNG